MQKRSVRQSPQHTQSYPSQLNRRGLHLELKVAAKSRDRLPLRRMPSLALTQTQRQAVRRWLPPISLRRAATRGRQYANHGRSQPSTASMLPARWPTRDEVKLQPQSKSDRKNQQALRIRSPKWLQTPTPAPPLTRTRFRCSRSRKRLCDKRSRNQLASIDTDAAVAADIALFAAFTPQSIVQCVVALLDRSKFEEAARLIELALNPPASGANTAALREPVAQRAPVWLLRLLTRGATDGAAGIATCCGSCGGCGIAGSDAAVECLRSLLEEKEDTLAVDAGRDLVLLLRGSGTCVVDARHYGGVVQRLMDCGREADALNFVLRLAEAGNSVGDPQTLEALLLSLYIHTKQPLNAVRQLEEMMSNGRYVPEHKLLSMLVRLCLDQNVDVAVVTQLLASVTCADLSEFYGTIAAHCLAAGDVGCAAEIILVHAAPRGVVVGADVVARVLADMALAQPAPNPGEAVFSQLLEQVSYRSDDAAERALALLASRGAAGRAVELLPLLGEGTEPARVLAAMLDAALGSSDTAGALIAWRAMLQHSAEAAHKSAPALLAAQVAAGRFAEAADVLAETATGCDASYVGADVLERLKEQALASEDCTVALRLLRVLTPTLSAPHLAFADHVIAACVTQSRLDDALDAYGMLCRTGGQGADTACFCPSRSTLEKLVRACTAVGRLADAASLLADYRALPPADAAIALLDAAARAGDVAAAHTALGALRGAGSIPSADALDAVAALLQGAVEPDAAELARQIRLLTEAARPPTPTPVLLPVPEAETSCPETAAAVAATPDSTSMIDIEGVTLSVADMEHMKLLLEESVLRELALRNEAEEYRYQVAALQAQLAKAQQQRADAEAARAQAEAAAEATAAVVVPPLAPAEEALVAKQPFNLRSALTQPAKDSFANKLRNIDFFADQPDSVRTPSARQPKLASLCFTADLPPVEPPTRPPVVTDSRAPALLRLKEQQERKRRQQPQTIPPQIPEQPQPPYIFTVPPRPLSASPRVQPAALTTLACGRQQRRPPSVILPELACDSVCSHSVGEADSKQDAGPGWLWNVQKLVGDKEHTVGPL
eukprot:TRINITY_DN40_c0_g2_i1.p1 TRINITY_DN40_c0_g2~~TRINITY_DN40_c0_g2_i1.p1  ORF type:complete len:1068 (-),score=254.30 TRINITY_DN40_c0_g2_i1:1188-4391(-)